MDRSILDTYGITCSSTTGTCTSTLLALLFVASKQASEQAREDDDGTVPGTQVLASTCKLYGISCGTRVYEYNCGSKQAQAIFESAAAAKLASRMHDEA